jgi:tetratricopeptide (TPR) repeat protein
MAKKEEKNAIPLNLTDQMGDMLSSQLSPPCINSSERKWDEWEKQVMSLAEMAGDSQNIMESTINLMSKIAFGERRKSNCEVALKILTHCEDLTHIHEEQISKLCFLFTLFNTGYCLHFMKQNENAIEKLKLVEKKLIQFLNINIIGKKVILFGLKNANHLNNKIGIIFQLNLKPNRHGIQLLSSDKVVSVNISNLKIYMKNGEKKDVQILLAKTHHYLGASYCYTNDEKANFYYTKALQFFSSSYSEKSMDLIHFCGSYLEFIQRKFSNVRSILKMHQFHLKTIEEICGKESQHYATALNCVGNYYLHYKHDFEYALELFLDANDLTPNSVQKVQLMLNLVNTYERKKDLKNALKYAKIGLKLAKQYLPMNHELKKGLLEEYKALKSPKECRLMLSYMDKIIEQDKLESKNLPKLNKLQEKLIRFLVIDRRCGFCAAVNVNLKACLGCENIYYCCEKHQKRHWTKHKKKCKKSQKQRLLEEEKEENEEAEN